MSFDTANFEFLDYTSSLDLTHSNYFFQVSPMFSFRCLMVSYFASKILVLSTLTIRYKVGIHLFPDDPVLLPPQEIHSIRDLIPMQVKEVQSSHERFNVGAKLPASLQTRKEKNRFINKYLELTCCLGENLPGNAVHST